MFGSKGKGMQGGWRSSRMNYVENSFHATVPGGGSGGLHKFDGFANASDEPDAERRHRHEWRHSMCPEPARTARRHLMRHDHANLDTPAGPDSQGDSHGCIVGSGTKDWVAHYGPIDHALTDLLRIRNRYVGGITGHVKRTHIPLAVRYPQIRQEDIEYVADHARENDFDNEQLEEFVSQYHYNRRWAYHLWPEAYERLKLERYVPPSRWNAQLSKSLLENPLGQDHAHRWIYATRDGDLRETCGIWRRHYCIIPDSLSEQVLSLIHI